MIIGIDDISIFRIFFDIVFDECETVELILNPHGMKVSILDKGHTCFYEVFYSNAFFDMFDVDDVEVVSLFIDDLYKILKTAGKKEYLTLSSDGDKVVAKFESEKNSRIFELTQSENFDESPTPPLLNADCEVKVPIDNINQSLKDLDIFKAGNIHLVCDGEKLIMAASTDSSMNYNHIVEVEATGKGDSYYTNDYLKKLIKFKGIDKDILLKFGETMPLSWEIKSDTVTVSGLIAPRIQED